MMRIQKGSKLIMVGDSITDSGRARPIAEGLFDPLGRGYVTMVEALLGAVYPSLGIRVINSGNSGNTIRDLATRWQSDVLDARPDWVSIMIGINDVWRQFDLPRQKETHVYIDEYTETLDQLLAKTSSSAAGGVVLMTPYYIEPNRKDPMRATMDRYGAAVRKLARKHKTLFVDTQAAFDQVLKVYYPGTLAWDRVHPNQAGHMVIARAFLNAVGFQW
jgi:lysophospholipase L1-like esterase